MANLTLSRFGGIGDLLMLLGACNALRRDGNRITINTIPKLHRIASACPFVNDVTYEPGLGIDMGGVTHGISQQHQTDAYLEWLGYDPEEIDPNHKEIVLNYPASNTIKCASYTIVHPSIYEGGNRGAGRDYWQSVITALNESGHNVVTIAAHGPNGEAAHEYMHTIGTLTSSDVLDTVAVISRARALVSIDSGPIHMAGATNTPIVGIFSVAKAEYRLPYRHGELGWNAIGLSLPCEFHPCYKSILDTENVIGIEPTVDNINKLFGEYCPSGDHHCLMVDPHMVIGALNTLEEGARNGR